MLSYRHSFHAGNYADVLKHLVQIRVLRYLSKKPKPFCYLDTHAGAGGYSLTGEHANKTQEYLDGVARLWELEDLPEPLQDYLQVIKEFNRSDKLTHYPGSPAIAAALTRKEDKLWLYELHPTDFKILRQEVANQRRIRCEQSDGFKGAIAKLPPLERRGMVLIDPPYELKEDYQRCAETLIKAHRKFSTGCYALWYPVVDRNRIDQLERKLVDSGIRNIQLFELSQTDDSDAFGMTSAGMIVINPPWTLHKEMKACLPLLADKLGSNGQGNYRCEVLVPE
ncbi:23S rRNA (adenine(2030)-N(6))-methyltransferase RlmJ [Corallincola platygyrae]|uniref:Ribosomal RNA large subunit methyltransferase J n=1 Tax=Corallincola platygyrae TaxID=1193278 RepID=A0ABW4XMT6_9GAMM